MPKGYVYILECSDGTFYTGSTIDLEKRIDEHQDGKGANHTKKRLPIQLVYVEEFQRIDDAFHREKQIQGWSRNKKTALIDGNFNVLPRLSECKNDSHYKLWLRLRSATKDGSISNQEKRLRQRSATEEGADSAAEIKSNSTIKHKLDMRNNDTNDPSDSLNPKFKLTTPVAERSRSYSHGKLLITGEYVVLDGALALAVPTQFGQSMTVEPSAKNKITWKSLDDKGKVWFKDEFSFEQIAFPFLYEYSQDLKSLDQVSKTLLKILFVANQLNKNFLSHYVESGKGLIVTTKLDFPREWGLGSSSTLINNIANWANVDAYQLLGFSLGGSGYDIACAQHDSAITYQLLNKKYKKPNQSRFLSGQYSKPKVCQVVFDPEFKDALYFVHLNKKQNSRKAIEHYKKNTSDLSNEISEISSITSKIIECKRLDEFESLIDRHEAIISNMIKQPRIKDQLFGDYKGSIKSLGAWGGDFILATSKEDPSAYFKAKGFETVIPFDQMVLK